MFILGKEDFIKAMEEVQGVWDYHDDLNSFLHKHQVEGYLFQPDCVVTVLSLFDVIFGEADREGWIEYFITNLNFGRKWEPKMVLDKDGADIDLSDSGKLYDFLVKNMEEISD